MLRENKSVFLDEYLRGLDVRAWLRVKERLSKHLVKNPETKCHESTYAISKEGYSYIGIGGRKVRVYQLAWVLERGSYAAGYYIWHSCGVKHCCNTSHLSVIPAAEHIAKTEGNGPKLNRAKTHCPEGHAYSKENTYLHRGRRNCRTCNRIRQRAYYHNCYKFRSRKLKYQKNYRRIT